MRDGDYTYHGENLIMYISDESLRYLSKTNIVHKLFPIENCLKKRYYAVFEDIVSQFQIHCFQLWDPRTGIPEMNFLFAQLNKGTRGSLGSSRGQEQLLLAGSLLLSCSSF